MKIDANNLTNDQKQLVNQYDEEHKIKGSFSKFLEMGAFAATGAFLGAAAPALTLVVAQVALNINNGPVLAVVATTAVIVGAGAGAISGLYVGNALHKEHNEKVEKENIVNMELSPADLVEKKTTTMSNINAIREKASMDHRKKQGARSDGFINLMAVIR